MPVRFSRVLGGCAALAVAGLSLAGAAGWHGAGVATVFGWQRVAVVHLLSTLPASVCLAALVTQRFSLGRPRLMGILWASVGTIVALFVAGALPDVARAVDADHVGFIARALLRVGTCLILELPWCLAAECWAEAWEDRARRDQQPDRATLAALVIAILAAVGLPAAYAVDLYRRQTAVAADLIERQQLVAAQRVITRLCAIGSVRPIAGIAPAAIERKLAESIVTLDQRLEKSQIAEMKPAGQIEQARLLAMLDRGAEASQLLNPLAAAHAEAALLLAAVLQQQRQWTESSQWYRTGAELLQAEPDSAANTAGRVRALNGLAFNARERTQYAEAEAAYRQGLATIPAAAGHFHFQLGRHYQQAGRPLSAAEHLKAAAELAPETYAQQAQQLLRQLAAESPGCVLGTGLAAPAGAPKR
ncbi:MAG TPA: hypothetical protein VGG64_12860 [Pirellulales bacterium]